MHDNENLPLGMIANTAAIMGITLRKEIIKAIRKKLYQPDFQDLTVVDFSDLAQGCTIHTTARISPWAAITLGVTVISAALFPGAATALTGFGAISTTLITPFSAIPSVSHCSMKWRLK